jgi:putative aminopeptidase FrvX
MTEFICHKLDELGDCDYRTDEFGQIFKIKKNQPFLCAHIDQVGIRPITKVWQGYIEGTKSKIIFGDGNLGADDKNGIWIILRLLKANPDLNFVFSTAEETGGNLHEIKCIKKASFAIVLDRRGSSDVIGVHNDYCDQDFYDAVLKIGKAYGYKEDVGVFSDADHISTIINCVNISVGYYNAHTTKEYTVVDELVNAARFAYHLILSKKLGTFKRSIKKRSKWYMDDYSWLDYSITRRGYKEYNKEYKDEKLFAGIYENKA